MNTPSLWAKHSPDCNPALFLKCIWITIKESLKAYIAWNICAGDWSRDTRWRKCAFLPSNSDTSAAHLSASCKRFLRCRVFTEAACCSNFFHSIDSLITAHLRIKLWLFGWYAERLTWVWAVMMQMVSRFDSLLYSHGMLMAPPVDKSNAECIANMPYWDLQQERVAFASLVMKSVIPITTPTRKDIRPQPDLFSFTSCSLR